MAKADLPSQVVRAKGSELILPPDARSTTSRTQVVDEADNPSRIFNGNLSYSKGMAIIHMIRFELQNDDIFFETLRIFIAVYADSVATGLDFKAVLEETSGMDFTDFFDQWYFGAGYPIYETSREQQDGVLTLGHPLEVAR